MIEIGYKLCSEEQSPHELIECARSAEEAGFSFAMISDHFHPWTDQQGQSPFVWTVIGAIAQVTKRMKIGAGVTCPTIRIHPAIIAHATATTAALLPGRFIFGVGAGENLNEHILGDHWPEAEARRTAHKYWPNAAIKGELTQILPVPAHFEQATQMVTEEDVAKEIICGPAPQRHIAMLEKYAEAGFDHIWVHQVGPDQEGLFRFYEEKIFPNLPQRLKAKSSGKGKKTRAAGGGR